MAIWAFDELREIIADKEFATIDTNGWCVTVDGEVNHSSSNREGVDKTTFAFSSKD